MSIPGFEEGLPSRWCKRCGMTISGQLGSGIDYCRDCKRWFRGLPPLTREQIRRRQTIFEYVLVGGFVLFMLLMIIGVFIDG